MRCEIDRAELDTVKVFDTECGEPAPLAGGDDQRLDAGQMQAMQGRGEIEVAARPSAGNGATP
jgi:hypothetical protein